MVIFQRRILAERLQIAPVEGLREGSHLRAGVIDVVLALDAVTGGLQHVRQRVAQHGVPRRPHVQRAGRVGADELDLTGFAVHQVDIAELRALRLDALHLMRQPALVQTQVDEAGRRDLDSRQIIGFSAMWLAMAWAMASGAMRAERADCMATDEV